MKNSYNDLYNVESHKKDYYKQVDNFSYDDMTLEDISKETNKSLKFLRREVSKGNLKKNPKSKVIRVCRSDYLEWLKLFSSETTPITSTMENNCSKLKNNKINWIDISKEMKEIDGWKDNNTIKNINFIDLFAGAGGLSCGLVMAGMFPIGSVEIMPTAVETYKYNFCKLPKFIENIESRDIRKDYVKNDLVNSVKGKHIHLIAGGFPCQGFSMAGNRIVTDPRNSLYLDMLDIVQRIKPDFVLMENVEGLRSMLNGKIEEKIISDYKKIGYKINVTVLNSADYGVPQIRRRVIFIGNRLGLKNYYPKPILNEDNYNTAGGGY